MKNHVYRPSASVAAFWGKIACFVTKMNSIVTRFNNKLSD